jgi:hypothetical protein
MNWTRKNVLITGAGGFIGSQAGLLETIAFVERHIDRFQPERYGQ